MKKTYQKPRVLIESFTVSEMIAAGSNCGAVVDSMDGENCKTDNPLISDAWELGFFIDGNTCAIPYTADEYNGVCLHGPADNAIYTS